MGSKRDQRRRRQRAEGRAGAKATAARLGAERHAERIARGEVGLSSGRVEAFVMLQGERRAFTDAEREAAEPLDAGTAN